MGFVRGILALITIAYGLFNSIAPISTALFKLQDRWPAGWTIAQKVLLYPPFGMGSAGTNRYQALMQSANWLQVGLWLLADLLYILAGFRLMGSRPRGAFPVFLVAFLLDVATWFTFKRMPVYDQTFSASEQQHDYIIFGVVFVLGLLVFLTGQAARRPRAQPAVLSG